MKKLFGIALTALVCIFAFGQQKGFVVGTNASLSLTGIMNQNPYGLEKMPTETTFGNTVGLHLGYRFNDKFTLSVDPQFASTGQNHFQDLGEDNFNSRSIRLNYVQVPVLANYTYGQTKIKFHIEAGPQIGFLTASQFDQSLYTEPVPTGGKTDGDSVISDDSGERFNSTELGGVLGFGAIMNLSEKLQFKSGIRLTQSFTDLNSNEFQYEDQFEEPYAGSRNISSGLNFGVVYLF